jgi:hypothetical protein
MATADLWAIIERVNAEAEGDLDASVLVFRRELEALSNSELSTVVTAFSDAMQRAYDWSLWAAAYVIHGGCGDDAFWDFRAGLVALGRDVYEAALKDADSLAAVEDIEDRTIFEGFQYVPTEVLEARGLSASGTHSAGTPSGEDWDENDHAALERRLPKLARRFDWH